MVNWAREEPGGVQPRSLRDLGFRTLRTYEPALMAVQAVRRYGQLSAYLRARKRYQEALVPVQQRARVRSSQIAAVIHLFYLDRWAPLRAALHRLEKRVPFDLFVTLGPASGQFASVVQEDFAGAVVVPVPNLGRDVLAFMQLAPALCDAGYQYVLKLHSKKSPHNPQTDWFESMVASLVPHDQAVLEDVLLALERENTGLIGPKGQYMSLTVALEGNLPYLRRTVCRFTTPARAKELLDHPSLGYFAGSMFWARFDALHPLLAERFPLLSYDMERGQVDGTLPHAIERLLTLVPILDGKALYEVGAAGVNPVDVSNGLVPWWSDVAIRAARRRC